MPTPVAPNFGTDFPEPSCLRTGDVLFPRRPRASPGVWSTYAYRQRFSERELAMTVREFLGPEASRWAATVEGRADLFRREALEASDLASHRSASTEQERLRLLVAILESQCAELAIDWFGITIEELIRHPLGAVLLGAFDGDIQDGFFIGHCGLVLRETDGAHADDGIAYVIEANVTSFDRYRVTMRPYYVAGDGSAGDSRYRSWAGYRASRGDIVWRSRHEAFAGMDAAAQTVARSALFEAAKQYEGRSYSFFDSSVYGDPGRLYCSEFVYRAFEDLRTGAGSAGPAQPQFGPVDAGVRTWAWMKAHNPPLHPGDIGHAIKLAWDDTGKVGAFVRTAGRPFFILTVQMLWCRLMATALPPLHGGEPYETC